MLCIKKINCSLKWVYSQISIQVMIQPQNRQMSFSLYICALAVADTIALLNGKKIYTSLMDKEIKILAHDWSLKFGVEFLKFLKLYIGWISKCKYIWQNIWQNKFLSCYNTLDHVMSDFLGFIKICNELP